MEALSLASLHETLTAAITRLPYYRRVPRNFPVARAAEVLRERFPVVTKETLLENRDNYIRTLAIHECGTRWLPDPECASTTR